MVIFYAAIFLPKKHSITSPFHLIPWAHPKLVYIAVVLIIGWRMAMYTNTLVVTLSVSQANAFSAPIVMATKVVDGRDNFT